MSFNFNYHVLISTKATLVQVYYCPSLKKFGNKIFNITIPKQLARVQVFFR